MPRRRLSPQGLRNTIRELRRASGTGLLLASGMGVGMASWRLHVASATRRTIAELPARAIALPIDSSTHPSFHAPAAAGVRAAPQASTAAPPRDAVSELRARLARTGGHTPASEVDRWILRMLSEPEMRSELEAGLGRMTRFEPLIRATLRRHDEPADLLYLVIVESQFRESAVSHAGAAGMWQFMASTGRLYDLEVSEYVDERRDPVRSTEAAVRHLGDLYREFGSWHLALAAYNAGAGRVGRALGRHRAAPPGDERAYWAIRRSLPDETRAYVPLFLAAAEIARRPEAFGLRPRRQPPLAFAEVWVPGGVPLDVVARQRGIAPALLRQLNPHLVRGTTPPGRRWPVRVPPFSEAHPLENRGE